MEPTTQAKPMPPSRPPRGSRPALDGKSSRNGKSRKAPRPKPSVDFSVTGLLYGAVMVFMGLAAIETQHNLLFVVFGLMVGVLLIGGVVTYAVLRRVGLTRVLPESCCVGQRITLHYELHNQKRFWPSLSVSVWELNDCDAFVRQPYAYLLHASAGATVAVPCEVVLKRRGVHPLDRYQLCTSFPFGFVKRALLRSKRDTLVVYPALARVNRELLNLCRSAENTGAPVRPRKGGQDEFFGLREFRTGDNPRSIYWRRSARTGVLVAKEMTQVSPPRLLILVDNWLGPGSNGTQAARVAAAEASIAQAASLLSSALDDGLSVGLVCYDGQSFAGFAPARGKRHRRDMLALLARLPANRTLDAQRLMEAARPLLDEATTPVLFAPGESSMGLPGQGRVLVIRHASPLATRSFDFGDQVDFSRCMPVEQDNDRS